MNENNQKKISIGMPVYNAQEFLKKRIINILEQTFEDFELIISDNCSEDKTHEICLELSKTDKRIHYYHQNENKGVLSNFGFVLKNAKAPFFVWSGVDDIWHKDFLKECIDFLEQNDDYAGCIGRVERYGDLSYREISNDKLTKKIISSLRWSKYGPHEANGTYENKIKIYLKALSAQSIYGLYRTTTLQKSFISSKLFLGIDLAIILNILKFGNFHVIEKKLIKFYTKGYSSEGILNSTRKLGHNFLGKIFPYYPFTKWCWRNFDKIIFFKNLDLLFKLNFSGGLGLIYDIILRSKK